MSINLFPQFMNPLGGSGSPAPSTPQGGFISAVIGSGDISVSVNSDLSATLISAELNATVGSELIANVDASPMSASLGGSITAEINDGEL